MGDSYKDETGPVSDASLSIHKAKAEKFVSPLLPHINEAKAAIVLHLLSRDANEV